MKKLLVIGIMVLLAGGIFQSCEQAIEKNIGKSAILMSRSNLVLTFRDTLVVNGVDTLYSSLKDTLIQSIGVSRSGLSADYPALAVKVRIDSVYLKSMIQQANDPTVPDVQKSTTVLGFKNSMLIPSSYYQFTPDVEIAANQRVGDVKLVLSKARFARLKSTKIFLPVAIDTIATQGVNTTKAISVVQLLNAFVIKKK